MISNNLLCQAIDAIAKIPSLEMNASDLSEDVALLAEAWDNEADFEYAVASVCRALEQLASGAVQGSELKYELSGWRSYHFQHRRAQGERATMRIVYQIHGSKLRVRVFGHREIPQDIYKRIDEARRKSE